jgi:flavin reductase (DIM6/NTAB) family NADH-FMN oxidoreductase RutF
MYPFERFTTDAKKVLTQAQREAEKSGQSYIGTEHLLLAMFDEAAGGAARILAAMGITAGQILESIGQALGGSPRIGMTDLIPTSRVKRVIELSFEEAQRLGSPFVDSSFLLLGIAIEGESIAAKVLEHLGASRERLIAAVVSELAITPPAQPAQPELIDPQRFREVMSSFPSGVVIVTAFGHDGAPRGLTVNAFCAVSLEPPLALACIDKLSNTLPAVRHTNGFTANILAAGREPLARLMATKSNEKFHTIEWRRSDAGGGPILEHEIAAYAVCTLKDTIEAGDHWILVGHVVEGARIPDVSPLVYGRRDYFDL